MICDTAEMFLVYMQAEAFLLLFLCFCYQFLFVVFFKGELAFCLLLNNYSVARHTDERIEMYWRRSPSWEPSPSCLVPACCPVTP